MKMPLFIAFLFFLAACKNRDEHILQLKALSESLQKSTEIIKQENKLVLATIEGKLNDYQTPGSANIWEVKARRVQELSHEMNVYIEQLISKFRKDSTVERFYQEQAVLLPNKLSVYKDSVLAIFNPDKFDDGSVYKQVLARNLNPIKKEFPFESYPGVPGYFKDQSFSAALAWLYKLENEVAICENMLINQCNNFVSYGCNLFNLFHCISSQSTSYCKAGDTILITAGVGEFSLAMNPVISINGKQVPMGPEACVEYPLKASRKTGKHSVPLTIKFTQSDGTPVSLTRNIVYEVAH